MDTQFNPDIELTHRERGALAVLAASEGYEVLHRIIRSEVDKFVVDLLNASDTKTILEKHRNSKVAAQLYQGWTNHVDHEVHNYTAAMQSAGKPIDITEGLLDLGPRSREDFEISPLEGGNEDEY